ncbi:hypothetical protein [Mycetocola sp. 2940]|uniref:hypothetical protein n=1 Tax=Mycetocola sp. 2940 TaxID=3156452 RepID=UPI00339A2A6A
MDGAGFDPRYSPEFQRGFDPAADDADESPVSAETGPVERVPVPPTVRRIPPAPAARDSAEAGAVLSGPEFEESTAGTSGEPELPASPWRNPYLVALTVAGIALVVVGIGAFRWAVSQTYGGQMFGDGVSDEEMQEAMIASQLAWGLAPLLTLAGVLTLLGELFFVAHRWRPRRALDEDEFESSEGESLAGR